MWPAIGIASSALSLIQSLTSKSSSNSASGSFGATLTEAQSGSSSATGSSTTSSLGSTASMSTLLAAQGQASNAISFKSPQDALKDLFSLIDGDGNGQISKSEFENALGAGGTNVAKADDVFSKMDANGDGSVSIDEMSSALKGAGHHHHAHAAGGTGSSDPGTDPLSQLGQGNSTTSTAADGSTTTSITYSDGSTVSMTTPAAASAASYNYLERAIQRQAQMMSSQASTLGSALSLSA